MKTAMSEEELWKVVGEYERYLREGGEFDKGGRRVRVLDEGSRDRDGEQAVGGALAMRRFGDEPLARGW
jgi:hypothetical protein